MTAQQTAPEASVGAWKAFAFVALASLTVLGSVGASNPGLWSFSPYLLLPSLVAFMLGGLLVWWVRRTRGHMEAGAFAGGVGALLFVGGGEIFESLGPFGVPAVGVLMVFTYLTTKRVLTAFNLGWLVQWALLFLVLVNAAYLVQIVWGSLQVDTEPAVAHQAVELPEERPDVAVLILDEFASLQTAPLLETHASKLRSLEDQGYELQETAWSGYTVTAGSVPAILDGSYPLTAGEVIDDEAFARLGPVSRGANRLTSTLKAAGYRFTMVESGLWMSACGPEVDVCVKGSWLDEMTGALFERSAARWWYRYIWGNGFLSSGLKSMEATQRVLKGAAGNDMPDLVVSHILLPHVPYLVDDACQRHRKEQSSYSTEAEWLEGYQAQAGCVVNWLSDTLLTLDSEAHLPPAVIVVGDHGTKRFGQLSRSLQTWGPEDVAERLGTFSLLRFGDGCPTNAIDSTPQLVDHLLACFTGKSAELNSRHFLASYGQDEVEVVEYPPSLLDVTLVAGRSDK